MGHSIMTSRRGLLRFGAASALVGLAGGTAAAQEIATQVDPAVLDAKRKTPLDLYLTPAEAHAALQANPEIVFVDVRDPIEIQFVGHPEGLDKIIPLRIATHRVDPESGQYQMVHNPVLLGDFEALRVARGKSKDDPFIVTCRSGGRSAFAARILIEAGYTNVWNLIEGFEGDKNADGSRAVNGWRNAGLPWGYKLGPGVAWDGAA